MSGYARLVFSSIGLLLTFAANSVYGGLITFNVDLSGVDESSGDTLRVFGTLTVDPYMPITVTSISSALYLQQNSNAPLPLPSNPHLVGTVSDNLAWFLFDDMLFLNRTTNEGSFIEWDGFGSSTHAFLIFGSGSVSHIAGYSKSHPPNVAINDVLFKASGPVDGPFGFLVGTVTPEPSSLVMTAVLGAFIPLQRRRRRRK
jgi:hypothetical protein